ncbi:cytochrome o ubiquinol oxidase subunit I [Escherichia coli]|uniref:Cytochrome o ubiquinol oxidase subunit I n=1 Tax=Escherichia coli TaxID=562 RepID=A0A377B2D6_ECOLX|nr:cytochrome o ubiquinol oxidase subunit I [Escherichia coli]
MTGVLLAVPGADFVLHNSLFLIAHFHNVNHRRRGLRLLSQG